MITFWIIAFIFVTIISLVLAYRSMKDYQELPAANVEYGLFLIRNKRTLNLEYLKKLHELTLGQKATFSLERLYKGRDQALTLYLPKTLVTNIPELELLELEEYIDQETDPVALKTSRTNKPNLDSTIVWMISAKNNPQKELLIGPTFLHSIDLDEQQQFFFQVVCQPQPADKKGLGSWIFQVTIRVIVSDSDPNKRINLAKEVEKNIQDTTGLTKQLRNQSNSELFKTYLNRSLIPKEVSKFYLRASEIIGLLN